MTALVDDAFRAIAAATQGDPARLRRVLVGMTDDQVAELAQVVAALRVPVAAEVAARALRIISEPA